MMMLILDFIDSFFWGVRYYYYNGFGGMFGLVTDCLE
jgi:hypothetical protein